MALERKTIIVMTNCENDEVVTRGNFKKLCNELGLPYHSLKMLKFPILFKDFIIHKVEFK